jgi:hypothetical protein
MKIFNVDDEHEQIVLSVLDAISRCPEGEKIDAFVFGITYSDGTYGTGFSNASPTDISNIAGYLQLDANLRYMLMNRDKYELEEEGEQT